MTFGILGIAPGCQLLEVEASLAHEFLSLGGAGYGVPVGCGRSDNLGNGRIVDVLGVIIRLGGHGFRHSADLVVVHRLAVDHPP